ncbi:MAG: fimbria major subunit [Bacteroidaceae bacterium]|nr:fimbria major subunit [Bacteroidaceae bacterium]
MKKQILLGLLAVGMLAACSNDDSLNENKASKYGLIEGEPAYLSLGIAMPGDPQTRANEDWADGADAEYKVNKGTLVLFKGTNEADATLLKEYVLPTATFTLDGTATDQITSTSNKFVQEIDAPNLTGAEKLYAYVILNDGNATGIDYTAGQTFAAFSQQVLVAIGIANEATGYGAMNATNGLVMTSVPVSDAKGGDVASTGNVTTLTEIQATAVYKTKAEAEASSADVACIYVERAAVKVDVTFPTTIVDPANNTLKAELVGWCLGNVNNSASGYYNTRQFDSNWMALTNPANTNGNTKYRFVCLSSLNPSLPTGATHDTRFRTYFGYDVNYDATATDLNKTKAVAYVDATNPGDYTLASGDAVFTYENTFDEDNQYFGNTTYVSLLVKLNGGATFYTLEGEDNTAYTTDALLKTKLGANMMAQLSPSMPTITSTIDAKIAAALSDAGSALRTTAGCAETDVIAYTIVPVVTLGTTTDHIKAYTVALDFGTVTVNGSDATPAQITAINALIYDGTTTVADKLAAATTGKKLETVTEYTNGLTYYATRIAHFGDNETPWSAPAESYNDYDKIYPAGGTSLHVSPETPVNYGTNRANAWLGRWGIVRNNWYSLAISNITGIGDAAPLDYSGTATGTPGGTPDDNPEPKYYIAAHIHILPWVKRAQNVILK